MKKDTTRLRTARGIREYTYLGCPMTKNRSAWCFRMCTPDEEHRGHCGRLAPHSLRSSIQQGIAAHNRRRLAEHVEKLEHMYLVSPRNRPYDPGIRIEEGRAELVMTAGEALLDATGHVATAVLFKALSDAAGCAVASVVPDVAVTVVSFELTVARAVTGGDLVAHGRIVGASGDRILAEAMVTDQDGEEIARGAGAFRMSGVPLTPALGYD